MIEFNLIERAMELLHKGVSQGVGHAADALAEQARARCPVASGFLQSTIYVIAPDHDTYGDGFGSPPEDSYTLPEEPRPDGDLDALVGVAANYGAYVELGTRHMAPEPFLAPASEATGNDLESHFSHVEAVIAEGL